MHTTLLTHQPWALPWLASEKEFEMTTPQRQAAGPQHRLRYALPTIAAIAILLSGCGPELRRASITHSEVSRERSEQLHLARQIREKRAGRLRRVSNRLMPEVRQLCMELFEKKPSSCSYSVIFRQDDQLNAKADGRRVYIHSGMIRFCETDDELAIVVGHELAHNMLEHTRKKQTSMLLGAIVDAAIAGAAGVNTNNAFMKAAAVAYSQEYESEADYLGVYLAGRAGYKIDAAPLFWRKMAIEHPGSIMNRFNSTHPSTPERSVALRNTVAEIDAKRSARLALIPERIDNAPADTPAEPEAIAVHPRDPSNQAAFMPVEEDSLSYKPRAKNIGEWNYMAEVYAESQQCTGANGLRPVTIFKRKAAYNEYYEAQCTNREPLTLSCWQGGCSVIQDK